MLIPLFHKNKQTETTARPFAQKQGSAAKNLLPNLHQTNRNLGNIQQPEFLFSSPLYAGNHFPLITSERDVLPVNIPVAGFQFLHQPAFGYLPISDQPVIAHIM